MYQCPMADTDAVADVSGSRFICAVNDGPILQIHSVAHADAVPIATHHRLKPYVAFGTDEGSVFGEIAVYAHLRGEIADGFDGCHVEDFLKKQIKKILFHALACPVCHLCKTTLPVKTEPSSAYAFT